MLRGHSDGLGVSLQHLLDQRAIPGRSQDAKHMPALKLARTQYFELVAAAAHLFSAQTSQGSHLRKQGLRDPVRSKRNRP